MHAKRLIYPTVALLVSSMFSGAAKSEPIGTSAILPGWVSVTLPATKPALFRALQGGAIAVTSRSGFGLIYMQVGGAKSRTKRLSWRWRVDAAPSPTNLAKRGGDDRPLAVHVWFAAKQGRLTYRAVLNRIRGRLSKIPTRGAVLTYVWGGTSPRGTVMRNPYLSGRGALIVLRSGRASKGKWTEERIDIRADFRRVFGMAAPPIAFIAISADTDNRGGVSRARITPIQFATR